MDKLNAAFFFGEERGIGFEADLRAGVFALADDFEVLGFDAAFEPHLVDGSVAGDFDFHPFADKVGNAGADAVQAAAGFVGRLVAVIEFAARAQGGEDDFDGGDTFGRVNADRDAAAVVGHGARAVGVDLHMDGVREAGAGFVDAVVDDFVHQMV